MNSSMHAQAMLTMLGTLGQIASQRDQLRHQHAIAELQAGAFAQVVEAVITRRIEAVQEGFLAILNEFAAQAAHHMTQQDRFAAAELETNDPLRRIELRKRINDIDTELRQIRLDARSLYTRMTEVLLLLGGSALHADDTLSRQLMLAAPGR